MVELDSDQMFVKNLILKTGQYNFENVGEEFDETGENNRVRSFREFLIEYRVVFLKCHVFG